MLDDFWKNKKVLITGHTGFKGGWLSFILSKFGAKVSGYSLSIPTIPSFFEVSNLDKVIDHNIGDICDYNKLKQCIERVQPDIIFHMAAQSLVRYSYNNPIETYNTNVMGSVNLLEIVRKNSSVKATIIVTSDKCYRNEEFIYSYREHDRLGGFDPYSNSKACTELVVDAYIQSYFINNNIGCIASVRAGNVIGGGDWAKARLIPDVISALSKNERPVIRSPESIRPWQHVLEPLSGYMLVAKKIFNEAKQEKNMVWNFGPNYVNEEKVKNVVDTLCNLWQSNVTPHIVEDFTLHEAKLLTLDNTKARNELNWVPKWDINQALLKTVDWYKCYYSNLGVNTNEINVIINTQIEEYFNL